MYAILKTVFYGAGGLAIVWAVVSLFGQPLYSLLSLAVAALCFYVTRFLQPPEAEEAPPPDIDLTTDYRKEVIRQRKERQKARAAAKSSEAQSKGQ